MPATPHTPQGKDSVHRRHGAEASSVQRFLPIAEIRQDCVILKNGGVRAVLTAGSMNFNLKSEDEQMAILRSYQGFLNTITFPIQTVVRSMKLNVDNYLQSMRKLASEQGNPLLKENTLEYCTFIERLIETADIMQKKFYVVVPIEAPGQQKVTFLQKYLQWLTPGDTRQKALVRQQQFAKLAGTLNDRVNLVRAGLEAVGVGVRRLSTVELIELFYEIYNPETSQTQKLADMSELKLSGEVL